MKDGIEATIYDMGDVYVITYSPDEEKEGDTHNCDAQGCGTEHVWGRIAKHLLLPRGAER